MRRIHSSRRYPGLIPIATTRDQSLTSVKHEDRGQRPDVGSAAEEPDQLEALALAQPAKRL